MIEGETDRAALQRASDVALLRDLGMAQLLEPGADSALAGETLYRVAVWLTELPLFDQVDR